MGKTINSGGGKSGGGKSGGGLSDLIAEEVAGHEHHTASEPLDAFAANEPLDSPGEPSDAEVAETRLMKNPLTMSADAPQTSPDARRMAKLPAGINAELVVRDSNVHFAITKSLTIIGRVREVADIVIADDKASRHHAAITFENGRFFLEDLDSTNGTYVNGARIKRMELQPNVEIRIGRCKMHLQVK